MSIINNLDEFTTNFLEEYEGIDPGKYNSETKFRNIETWDSLTGMAVVTMIEDECGVILTDDEFMSCDTISEVFKLVREKA
ncbi:MAG: hypothetical protein CL666_11990 [Balneola sp.]|nr:hypothetical protein [Balneola sp.]|tara:strand:- start:23908 stop:24150 length:243 start_codon:yes stop_codon:yes gene_type:complete